MTADEIKALIERLRDGTNTSWEQTFLDCREAAGTLESLLQQRNIALLDAERAREERNSVHVRLNAEWLLKLKKLDEENQRLRLEFRADCEKQAEELFAAQRDASRYRWWRNWVFRAGMDGLPSCTYLADVEDPRDIDSAIDAARSQSEGKPDA